MCVHHHAQLHQGLQDSKLYKKASGMAEAAETSILSSLPVAARDVPLKHSFSPHTPHAGRCSRDR